MNMMSAPVPLVTAIPAGRVSAGAILTAAKLLLPQMAHGQPLPSSQLRKALEAAFGASDASGAWDWKTVYETGETASVLFLRKYGRQLFQNATTPLARLAALNRIADLFPTHTRRSEESQAFQQFSTPLPLALAALTAAQVSACDHVLEPSAGTGLLAILADICGAALSLNELAEERAELLTALFPASPVSRHDAAQINDHLADDIAPSVILMNPPFSVMANVSGRVSDAAFRHIASALARLQPGGRLVAITGAGLSPDNPAWTEAFNRLQESAFVVFSAAIDGSVYASHGTTTATRLTVIDKRPRTNEDGPLPSLGMAPDVATLIDWIAEHVPARMPVDRPTPPRPPASGRIVTSIPRPRTTRSFLKASLDGPTGEILSYDLIERSTSDTTGITDAIYEEYRLQTVEIPGARPHPTKLVQSAAMASVTPPKPSYRPTLPADIHNRLSAAQLETVIFAGEAHTEHLAGHWRVDSTYDQVSAAPDDAPDAVRFRRGFMLGDGTGAGKGRQSAGIILDNWLQGRRKAVWISKSDKLIEDAQRDWAALGMERLLVTPLSRFAQGKPVNLPEGILFTTYATLRSEERGEKCSRLQQIIDWLGAGFDGAIIFDESHAMQNAAGGKGERGDIAASQQGRAGLRLQHALPDARVVYVSATGATHVHNLAYAQRLGLWGGEDFPFANRSEFITAIEGGGVAAMEVLARDLRALGLYTARSLSYDGVEYELLEHQLTNDQVATGRGTAGKWTDAATGEHGDLLDVIRLSCRLSRFADAIDEARTFLSLPRLSADRLATPVRAASPEAARRLFGASHSIADTLAMTYLRGRKLYDLRGTEALRFHPHCYVRACSVSDRKAWPALIGAVTDFNGAVTGAHRTWLNPATADKAPIDPPRKAMGHLLGNAVRFGTADIVLAAGEGIETVLSLRQVMPELPLAATLSAAHLSAFLFPPELQRLYVVLDRDQAGRRANRTLADRAAAAGIEAIPLVPRLGDFNEDLCAFDVEHVRTTLLAQIRPEDVNRFMRRTDLR